MKAAVVRSFDAAPRYSSFADPVPAAGEVMVRVAAAGLHPIVKALASGMHYAGTGELPFVPGIDGVGRLDNGKRIYFGFSRSPFGSFAERTVVAGGLYLALPDQLDDVTAAGLANPGMSAWVALTARAGFVAGESVLILGATGIAGSLAVQIAKRLGARRIAAAGRNPQALEPLKDLGADAIISLDQDQESLVSSFRRELHDFGTNIILDYLWGAPAEALLAAIAQKGLKQAASRIRFLQIGESAGRNISLPAATLRSSGLELLGSGFGSASTERIFQALEQFFAAAAKEPFRFHVKPVPLHDVETFWNSSDHGARLVFQP